MLSLDLLRAAKKNVPLKWGVGVCGVRGRRLIFVFFWGGRGRPVTPYLLYKYSQSLFLAHLNNEPEIDTVNIYIEDRGATRRPPSTFKKKKFSQWPQIPHSPRTLLSRQILFSSLHKIWRESFRHWDQAKKSLAHLLATKIFIPLIHIRNKMMTSMKTHSASPSLN